MIYHVPFNEANNPNVLCNAEKCIGLESRIRIVSNDGFFGGYVSYSLLTRAFKRLWIFFEVLVSADVVHYNYGSFLAPALVDYRGPSLWKRVIANFYDATLANLIYGADVRLFSYLGKKIYVTYQGSDLRQSVFCSKRFKIHFYRNNPDLVSESDDEAKLRRLNLFLLHAEKIFVLNPDLMHVMPNKLVFLPYSSVDIARVASIANVEKRTMGGVFRIVHAPSNRRVKGTAFLEDAVMRLRIDHPNVELVLVEGLSNDKALQIYESADLVVDQLLAGWYGGFAVECLALSKPVISYLRVEDFCFLPEEMVSDLPIVNADPETIYEVLKLIVNMQPEELLRLGTRGHKFVSKWHNPESVALFVNGKSGSFARPDATSFNSNND